MHPARLSSCDLHSPPPSFKVPNSVERLARVLRQCHFQPLTPPELTHLLAHAPWLAQPVTSAIVRIATQTILVPFPEVLAEFRVLGVHGCPSSLPLGADQAAIPADWAWILQIPPAVWHTLPFTEVWQQPPL